MTRITVVVVTLVLVAGVAAQGSRAEPVSSAQSAAFQQCQTGCQRLTALGMMPDETGGSTSSSAGETTAETDQRCFLCGAGPFVFVYFEAFGGDQNPPEGIDARTFADAVGLAFDPAD